MLHIYIFESGQRVEGGKAEEVQPRGAKHGLPRPLVDIGRLCVCLHVCNTPKQTCERRSRKKNFPLPQGCWRRVSKPSGKLLPHAGSAKHNYLPTKVWSFGVQSPGRPPRLIPQTLGLRSHRQGKACSHRALGHTGRTTWPRSLWHVTQTFLEGGSPQSPGRHVTSCHRMHSIACQSATTLHLLPFLRRLSLRLLGWLALSPGASSSCRASCCKAEQAQPTWYRGRTGEEPWRPVLPLPFLCSQPLA